MKILVAPNALKGSLGPIEAARAIAEGLARSLAGAEIDELPIADGGDATAAVLVHALGGSFADALALDPLGRSRNTSFGLIGEGKEALIEVARSSGLALLAPHEHHPLVSTSYGVGQLVEAALDRGCRRIDIALGGSATVDGGAGLVEALGVRLLDANGDPLARGGGELARLEHIDVSGIDARVAKTDLVALCDVDNALLGEHGAAKTFGPQKGATPDMVDRLEASLAHFSAVIERDLGRDVRRLRHGGAAGGMAAASATDLAIGPAVSCAAEIGTIPVRLTSPRVGLMPTTPFAAAGDTIEPSVSVPMASGTRAAATATPEPELDPDGLRPGPCGFTAWPPSVLQPLLELRDRKLAHSDRLALPRITAPAARSRVTQNASASPAAARAGEPAVAGMPVTDTLSLIRTGMPSRGPRAWPAARRASLAAASAAAWALTVITACRAGFSCSMRAR